MLYRLEYVRCGKPGCWCSHSRIAAAQGRQIGHGPYWYGYWIEQGARGRRLREKYVGKKLPELRERDRVAYEAERIHADADDPALSLPPVWSLTLNEKGAGTAGGR